MNLIRKKIMRKCISFVLATLLLMQAFTPVISYARTVDPQSGNGSSGKLQFTLSDEGVLTWNAADGTSLSGATGYEVILRNNAGSLEGDINLDVASFDLIGYMDKYKKESGRYTIQVNIKGISAHNDLWSYQYVSPFDKLNSPSNLRWNGKIAEWDAVTNADGYTVALCTEKGNRYTSRKISGGETTSADFSDIEGIGVGWFFMVTATGDGYRESNESESPKCRLITSAKATITAPKGGAHPDFSALPGYSAAYTVEVVAWYDKTNGYKELTAESVYEDYNDYSVKVRFVANEGYKFADDAKFIINEITSYSFYEAHECGMEFTAQPSVLKNIFLTAGLPNKLYAGGKLPKYTDFSVPENAEYTITDFGWYEAKNYDEDPSEAEKLAIGTTVDDGTAIESGKTYYAVFTVEKEAGYIFAPEADLKSYINNSRVDVSMSRESNGKVIVKKAYTAQNVANARYTIKYVDMSDESHTWTEEVNGVGTAYTLTDYLEAPAGKEHRFYVLRSGTSNDDTTENTQYHPGDNINVNSNLIFDAAWKARTYTVHFTTAEGTGTMEDVTTGLNYELPECGFTPKTGREFYKWNYDGTFYDPGDTITIKDGYDSKTTEITLKAVWKSSASDTVGTITVQNVVPPVEGQLPDTTFALRMGEHTHPTTVEELAQAYADLWNSQNNTTEYTKDTELMVNFAKSAIKDQTWHIGTFYEGEYTYLKKYGTGDWKSDVPFAADGKYMITLFVSADDGYVFSDVTTTPEFLIEGEDYENAYAKTYNPLPGEKIKTVEIYFTAKKANMDITFAAGDGTGTMEAVEVATGSEYTLPECTFTAPEGKEFDRWKIGTKLYAPGSKIKVKDDLTLTAIWATDVRPSYVVKVTNDGLGTASSDLTEAKAGTTVNLTATPKAGQTFRSWLVVSAPGDTLEITNNGFTMPDGDVEIMACFHDHDYTENVDDKYLKFAAGCVGKAVYYKSCAVCGLKGEETFEHGEALGHTWVNPDGVQTKAPSCTEYGERSFTCSVCGAVETQKIDPLGHDWGEWTVVTPATETTPGMEKRVCKRDATHEETREIPVLNHAHTLVHHVRVEATETTPGNIEYWECSGCGRYFSDADGKNEINATDIVIPAGGTSPTPTPGTGEDVTPTPTPGTGDDITPTPALKEGEVYISPEDAAAYVTPAKVSKETPVSVAVDGDTVSLNLKYDYTNAVTYTGEKIAPDGDFIKAKLDLSDIVSQVSANEGVKLTQEELFTVSYKISNNKDVSRTKNASFYARIKINKGVNKLMPKAEYKKLQKLVSAANKLLKANKCEFTINPKPITECSPEIIAKFKKDGSVKTVKRTGLLSGEKVYVSLKKKTKLSKKMYTMEAPVTGADGTITVKLTGKKNYTGTAVVTIEK